MTGKSIATPAAGSQGNLVGFLTQAGTARARLPQQIINARRWTLWKLERGDPRFPSQKPRKVPYYANGFQRCGTLDSPEDIAQLVSYDDALNAFIFGDADYEGLGFALGPDGAGCWQGIDLDDVSKKQLSDLANALPSYVEMSPSGNGAHAIGYGQHFVSLGSNTTGIEAYAGKRYFSCGGDVNTLAVVEAVPTKIDPVTKKAIATSFNIYERLEPAIEAFNSNPEARSDRPLGVIVLDAVGALVTWGRGENGSDDGAVKRLLAFLDDVSERHGVTIQMLGHLNKGTHSENIADAVTGSAAWTNSVRLGFMFVKDIESDSYEGFVRTAKTNTGTHFGATYRTVPRYTLRERPDGKNDVLCGVELVSQIVWGDMALREMMAGEKGDQLLDRVAQKNTKVRTLVETVLSQLKSASFTTRKSVEAALLSDKFNKRHWQKADEILITEHGIAAVPGEHGILIYSVRRPVG